MSFELSNDQLMRYARHILLDEFGIEAQQRVSQARVLIVGAGGLGSPAALYLAAAGVHTLTLADDDEVELSNLQRQILHNSQRVGINKAISGQQTLAELNPEVEVRPISRRLDDDDLLPLVAAHDEIGRASCRERGVLVAAA